MSRIWQDLEQNLYVMSGTNLRCINGTDHRTVLWAVSMPATGMQVVPVSDTKLVAYG